jgi:flavin reductase (DIM6/NTAB) family NADH-FMN oxidoreductase RutF
MADESFDPREFRKALSCFVTGVTVVTTIDDDGQPRGFTANSFTSVSLDPPLVLVCIADSAQSYGVFATTAHFGINILAEDHREVSNIFASKRPDKFDEVAWTPGHQGAPVFDAAVAWLDCAVHDRVDAGDHMILIGRVVGHFHSARRPLGYCRSNYLSLGLDQETMGAEEGRTRRVGAVLEADGRILFLVDPESGHLSLPLAASLGEGGAGAGGLAALLGSFGVDAEIEFLFAVYDDPSLGLNIYYRGSIAGDGGLDPARTRLIPFDDIPWDDLPGEATGAMLRRYITERRQDLFGIYVGDARSGEVQPLR